MKESDILMHENLIAKNSAKVRQSNFTFEREFRQSLDVLIEEDTVILHFIS